MATAALSLVVVEAAIKLSASVNASLTPNFVRLMSRVRTPTFAVAVCHEALTWDSIVNTFIANRVVVHVAVPHWGRWLIAFHNGTEAASFYKLSPLMAVSWDNLRPWCSSFLWSCYLLASRCVEVDLWRAACLPLRCCNHHYATLIVKKRVSIQGKVHSCR